MRVNRVGLLKQLQSVSPGLEKTEVIDQSHCFAFHDGGVFTFNDEVACRAKSILNIEGAVRADPLLKVLQKMTEEEVSVEVKEGQFTVKGNKKRMDIRMDAEVMMPVEQVEKPGEWRKLPSGFLDGLSMALSCAGRDDSQFVLTCVHVHQNFIEACDNFQLVRSLVDTGVGTPLLIRRVAVESIVRIGADELSETDSWAHFRTGEGLVLSCRRYADSYPDLEGLIEFEGGIATELPQGLTGAVNRAEILTLENKESNRVTIELRDGCIRLEGQGPSGRYREMIECPFDGEPIRFRISPKLLMEIVRRKTGCILGDKAIKVKGDKFIYISCVAKPEDYDGED